MGRETYGGVCTKVSPPLRRPCTSAWLRRRPPTPGIPLSIIILALTIAIILLGFVTGLLFHLRLLKAACVMLMILVMVFVMPLLFLMMVVLMSVIGLNLSMSLLDCSRINDDGSAAEPGVCSFSRASHMMFAARNVGLVGQVAARAVDVAPMAGAAGDQHDGGRAFRDSHVGRYRQLDLRRQLQPAEVVVDASAASSLAHSLSIEGLPPPAAPVQTHAHRASSEGAASRLVRHRVTGKRAPRSPWEERELARRSSWCKPRGGVGWAGRIVRAAVGVVGDSWRCSACDATCRTSCRGCAVALCYRCAAAGAWCARA